ncbi:hypothetical protein [Rhodococcoides corynebacterioides]|uniref:Uncharacterized protein n=1 Tax=Rhodococcoides corynebacterioides TaxID=53972 RepID=A0ABS7P3K5_9NOCA|nr:hypothetical protein [Rhodococcus corynebacterioides]MBY6366990.1 hypothetical protein [Rhodococcus corynebacterioides]MBY6407251.1 hypothetical protein [Rhodococcus corynebacterioides]
MIDKEVEPIGLGDRLHEHPDSIRGVGISIISMGIGVFELQLNLDLASDHGRPSLAKPTAAL